jgi:hypothetical protein
MYQTRITHPSTRHLVPTLPRHCGQIQEPLLSQVDPTRLCIGCAFIDFVFLQ